MRDLKEIMDSILKDAKNVVKDYEENPSELSGSIFQVHEDSPILEEKDKK